MDRGVPGRHKVPQGTFVFLREDFKAIAIIIAFTIAINLGFSLKTLKSSAKTFKARYIRLAQAKLI